jgi:hypothetical protein
LKFYKSKKEAEENCTNGQRAVSIGNAIRRYYIIDRVEAEKRDTARIADTSQLRRAGM